jgi:predicted RNase H-like nuclease (RuvC/YqgF family)
MSVIEVTFNLEKHISEVPATPAMAKWKVQLMANEEILLDLQLQKEAQDFEIEALREELARLRCSREEARASEQRAQQVQALRRTGETETFEKVKTFREELLLKTLSGVFFGVCAVMLPLVSLSTECI